MRDEPITSTITKIVDAGRLAGAAMLLWRDGRVIQAAQVGWRNIELKLPMERNTLFRIASMTKPITSTLALMLFDEGRFALNDPITRWAPEFSQMRVLRSSAGALDQTDPAERAITFEDLLSQRSGLTYGDFHSGPVAKAYREALLGGDIDNELLPDDWIARLAALPLIDQPGAGFHYGHSTDLLGLLIARMEDAPLGDVLKRRIFDPLGMNDTGFTVPFEKQQRRAEAYGYDDAGHLCIRRAGPGGSFLRERPEGMAYVSGGQGLWSTVDDYLTFAQMFLNAGSVNDIRLLQPTTFTRMVTNCLNEKQLVGARSMLAGHGFGLGVAMVLDPLKAGTLPCGGGPGAVGWPGAFGGWWRADPNNNTILVFLAHNMLDLEQLLDGLGQGVYDAIEQFQSQAAVLPDEI